MKQLQNDKIIAISATAILYVKTESKFCPNLKKKNLTAQLVQKL